MAPGVYEEWYVWVLRCINSLMCVFVCARIYECG